MIDNELNFSDADMQKAVEERLKELEKNGEKGLDNARRRCYNSIFKEKADAYLKAELDKVEAEIRAKNRKMRIQGIFGLLLTLLISFALCYVVYSGVISLEFAFYILVFDIMLERFVDSFTKKWNL